MPEPKYNREDHLGEEKGFGEKTDLTVHIEELRNRLFIAFFSILVMGILGFYFSGPIIKFLEAAAPEGANFFQIKPGELFTSSIKIAVYSGVILSMPVWLKQLDSFLKPGLKEQEKKLLGPVLFYSPLLFWTGMIFAYYLILPPLLEFLLGFREGIVETSYSLEHFLNLELAILVVCGIAFQLPIVLLSLGHFGLINAKLLLKIWRYVVLAAFTISAIITPTPDPITMSLLALAILGLYFLTIALMSLRKDDSATI